MLLATKMALSVSLLAAACCCCCCSHQCAEAAQVPWPCCWGQSTRSRRRLQRALRDALGEEEVCGVNHNMLDGRGAGLQGERVTREGGRRRIKLGEKSK